MTVTMTYDCDLLYDHVIMTGHVIFNFFCQPRFGPKCRTKQDFFKKTTNVTVNLSVFDMLMFVCIALPQFNV